MAKAEFIKALIKAHISGDNNKFRQVALQIAAQEASSGHVKVANDIRKLIDNVSPSFGQSAGKVAPELKVSLPKSNMSELLQSSYPRDKFNEMILSADTKEKLKRVLTEWRSYNLLSSYGLDYKKKLLLVGPPGNGKTLSAKVLSNELGLPLFVVKLEGLISRYLGETSVHLRSIFNSMENTPGVYLFDEFDSIGTTRGDQRDVGEVRRVLSTFLILLENFSGNSLIISATNYNEMLDFALYRRFDDVIEFPKPGKEEAMSLLKLKTKNFPSKINNYNELISISEGMSYAEIVKAVAEGIKTSILFGDKTLTQEILEKTIIERKSMNPNN
ncbi:AAA family ATPase [Bacillus sp. ISL-57]|uniref:AAA family ATPase n=1 Tax=Bacillus sp. ISL-57 TaxID=2819135 RepID=UPI001BE9B6E4|nr:ATP-binding protein [Bacillus sp. ISL-57]MBT2719070.1 ATP-binding protein [Bacillus sp. ISL-57]